GSGPGQFRGYMRRLLFTNDGQLHVPSGDGSGGIVSVFDSLGNYVSDWGAGSVPNEPSAIAQDDVGNFYVSDEGNRVEEFSSTHTLTASWGSPGQAPGQINGPSGIVVGNGGLIHVANHANNSVDV